MLASVLPQLRLLQLSQDIGLKCCEEDSFGVPSTLVPHCVDLPPLPKHR